MSDAISVSPRNEIAVQQLEKNMLEMPQVECPVIHRFGPGIYIRELHIPAMTFAVGHFQKHEHFNVMLKGRVLILTDSGATQELVAPFCFTGKPGRKIGIVLEDMVWQNIYATDETDVNALEGMFLDKSITFIEHEQHLMRQKELLRQLDRDDYMKMLEDLNVTHETVQKQSFDESDQIPLPHGGYKFMIAQSPIHGRGVFATSQIEAGETIAPARIVGKRTPVGRYTNHSMFPNARMESLPNGDILLVASRLIDGQRAGMCGDEITVDYRQSTRESLKYLETPCLV